MLVFKNRKFRNVALKVVKPYQIFIINKLLIKLKILTLKLWFIFNDNIYVFFSLKKNDFYPLNLDIINVTVEKQP